MKVLMVGTVKTKKSGGMATHTEELIHHLRNLGISVDHYKISPEEDVNLVIDKSYKAYTRTIGVSLKIIKDYKKFDIVHVQASGPLGGFIHAIVLALWKKFLKFNLVVTFHYGSDESFIEKHEKLFKFIISQSDIFCTVSKKQKEAIIKILKGNKNATKKIKLLYNGFDPRKFYVMSKQVCRSRLKLPEDQKIVLSVGTLSHVKGQEYLLYAMHIVLKHRKNVLLVFVGDGPLRDKLIRLSRELGINKNVMFVGAKPHKEIPLWMNAADIFVLPSLSEGNPTVMFEALGVGLPFVGTAVGGVPEIITSEDYGLLCPPADPECLAEKILIAFNKEWDREKIREYAKQFTWENIAKRTLGIYRQVLSKEARKS